MLDALPEREREAVILAAEGFTNAEISEKMFISERTVKAHISSAADINSAWAACRWPVW